MSITDELRKFIEDPLLGYASQDLHIEMLTKIADRIDAEHEAKVSYWQGASYKDGYDEGFASADDWLAQHEDAMAEHGWIRLPKDADGEHIHADDEMFWKEDGDSAGRVTAIGVGQRAGWVWTLLDGCSVSVGHKASLLRHHHAPTVEDVLTEFGIDWEHESDCEDRAALLKEYASKLRLAKEDA